MINLYITRSIEDHSKGIEIKASSLEEAISLCPKGYEIIGVSLISFNNKNINVIKLD